MSVEEINNFPSPEKQVNIKQENIDLSDLDQKKSRESSNENVRANALVEKNVLSKEEKKIIADENHHFSEKAAWAEFNNIGIDSKEAVQWFDAKYSNYQGENDSDGTLITLRDSSGRPIGEFPFKNIAPSEKIAHSSGTLNLIKNNYSGTGDFIENFNHEPELLNIIDKKLSTLPRLVKLYNENKRKLEQAK